MMTSEQLGDSELERSKLASDLLDWKSHLRRSGASRSPSAWNLGSKFNLWLFGLKRQILSRIAKELVTTTIRLRFCAVRLLVSYVLLFYRRFYRSIFSVFPSPKWPILCYCVEWDVKLCYTIPYRTVFFCAVIFVTNKHIY